MRPGEFIRAAGAGKLGAAYFLRGPERFLQDECRAAVIASLPEEVRSWCLAQFEFAPGHLARELEGAGQMPMLGGHNFLFFSDPNDFKQATDADHEALAAYLKRPPAFATLIFSAAEPDRRRRFIQLLEKRAEVVEMRPLGRRDAAAWLQGYLGRAQIAVAPELAERIVERFENSQEPGRASATAGVNLLWVRTEIEKLITARPGMNRLEATDLERMVSIRQEHIIGKLLRAIADRQFAPALEHLRALLASKESEMLLLWSIADLFRQALRGAPAAGRDYGRQGWNRWSNPFSTREIAPQVAGNFSRQEILQALRLVRQTDLGIKSSWKDSKILLEFLLWRLTAGRQAESFPAFELPAPGAET